MRIICKTAEGNCPKGLDICCCTCQYKGTCAEVCPYIDTKDCTHRAEVEESPLVKFESAVPAAIQGMTAILQLKKELDEKEKQLKQELLEAMEAYGVKSFETDLIKLTYVAPTTRSALDSTRLKKDHPEIVEQYSKTSTVSASVRITVK